MFVLPWVNMATVALTPLALVLIGFTVAIAHKTSSMPLTHPIQCIPASMAVASLIFTYVLSFRYLNRTRIEIGPDRVRVDHGPVPFRRAVEMEVGQIRRVYAKQIKVCYEGSCALFHELWVEKADGSQAALVQGEWVTAQALFLEKRLRAALNLPAAPAPPVPVEAGSPPVAAALSR